MKFAFAYYLLVIYATVILKPAIPVVQDSIEHCFAEAYHIATVHAKYGSNHVEKELEQNSESDSNNSSKGLLKDDDSVPVHLSVEVQSGINVSNNTNPEHTIQYQSFLPDVVLAKLSPPPKFS